MEEAGVHRWDRGRWISVFSSHNPTIREVTESLGLGLSASSSTTNRGIPKFDNPEYRKLSSEVTKLSKELPKEREALLDFAANPRSLDEKLEELLAVYGPLIWGRNTDRSCLLTPDETKKTYSRHLFYEEPEDREILKIHLHRWIIIKACYCIRNMKLKRSSIEHDSVVDMEIESAETTPKPQLLSPAGTPPAASPPPRPFSVVHSAVKDEREHSFNDRKRKMSPQSLSDGEEIQRSGVKRPYHSATMPMQRKSPRKSLKSLAMATPSNENVPPAPSQPQGQSNHFYPAIGAGAGLEAARPLLTPLSSADLNGAARPVNTSPSTFTAVNATPAPSTQNSPLSRNYSSPYGPSGPHVTASTQPPTSAAGPQPPASVAGSQPPATVTSSQPPSTAISQPLIGTTISPSPLTMTSAPLSTVLASSQPPTTLASSQPSNAVPSSLPPVTVAASQPPVAMTNSQPLTTAARSQPLPAPTVVTAFSPSQSVSNGYQAVNSPIVANGTGARNSPVAQNMNYASIAPLPPIVSHPPNAPPPSHPPSAHHSPHLYHAHTSSNSPVVTHASHVPHVPHHPHLSHSPRIPPAPPVQRILKSQPSEIPLSSSDIELLQCELLGSLMQYLFPKPDARPSEAALLRNLEYLWHLKTAAFRHQMGKFYDVQSKVLVAWIEERRKISLLRRSMETEPGVPATAMVDRLLAMNDLRVLRLKWKTMNSQDGNQTLSPEDLLCRTFAAMTNTEGTEYLFKDGLDRLNDSMFEFLRSEDMKIMMTKR